MTRMNPTDVIVLALMVLALVVLLGVVVFWVVTGMAVSKRRRDALDRHPTVGEIWLFDDGPVVVRKVTTAEIQWSYGEDIGKLQTVTESLEQWRERIRNRHVRYLRKMS